MTTGIVNISGINTAGLRKKATFNELIDYISRDPDRIKYPNRQAKQLRNGFELSQLDGEGFREMEQQHLQHMKEQYKENLLRQMATKHGVQHTDLT